MSEAGDGNGEQVLFIGRYTSDESQGITAARFDADTGAIDVLAETPNVRNPSYLAPDAAGRRLYAVSEVGDFGGERCGAVAAFAINDDWTLERLNAEPTGGAGPCHVSLHPSRRAVFAANYGGGSVAAFAVNDDGSLSARTTFIQHEGSGPNEKRQQAPHAHMILPDPAGRFVLTADLGIDRVMIYRFDESRATLEPNDPPHVQIHAGAGPRHLDFHPNGRWVYLINELDGTLAALDFDAQAGALAVKQTVRTLPEDWSRGFSGADVHVHPSGRWLYGTNRGEANNIVMYQIDGESGELSLIGFVATGGDHPRNFAIDPTGRWLLAANVHSDRITTFAIDQSTGRLDAAGDGLNTPQPTCVRFMQ